MLRFLYARSISSGSISKDAKDRASSVLRPPLPSFVALPSTLRNEERSGAHQTGDRYGTRKRIA